MAEVDPIVVEIRGEFAEIEKSLNAVKKKIKGVGDESSGSDAKLKKLGKALGVVATAATAAGAAAGALAAKQLEAARNTDILAKRLGIARSALSQLGAAGARFGVDTETLADAMKDLNVKITDAANGAKAYDEVFTKIGLSSKELVKLDPQQQFLKFADAIKKADENTRRFALDEINDAMFQLVPLMEQGSEAIKALGDEALRSGKALTEFDFKRMEEVNSATKEMSLAVEALGNALAIHLAPGLKLAAEWATKLAGAARDALGVSETGMRERLKEVNKELDKMRAKHETLKKNRRNPQDLGVNQRYIGLIQERVQLLNGLESIQQSTIKTENAKAAAIETTSAAIEKQMDLSAMFSEMMSQAGGPNLTDLGGIGKEEDEQKRLEAQEEFKAARLNMLFEELLEEGEIKENARISEEEAHTAWLDRMFGHDQRAQQQNLKLWEHSWKGKAQVTSKFLGQISNLMNTNSRKQFEIGKAAAIAQVVIDTPKAAMSAYSAMAGIPYVGPILGAAAAAATVAMGVSQIQQIKSTSFGGGGGGVGGGSFDAGGGAAAGGQGGGAPVQENVIDAVFNIQGSSVSTDQIRSVASGLNEYIEDGGRIRSVSVI